ncbi:MAG TPA: helix-hairpin-helix domain-containing protein [bacterium]|nr:helix-hairpin-helix domain-containing protein [bacterium]
MWKHIFGSILRVTSSSLVVRPEGIGLGIEVFVTPQELVSRSPGDAVEYLLYHHRTEAGESLFGLPDERAEILFRQLLKVSGVGGKTAILLMGLGTDTLLSAAERADEKLLSSVPGVGKKTAIKILLELKNSFSLEAFEAAKISPSQPTLDRSDELVSTLAGMGYDKTRIRELSSKIPEDIVSLQDRVVWMIREMAV